MGRAFFAFFIFASVLPPPVLWAKSRAAPSTSRPIVIYYGFLRKVRCEGKLIISGVGNRDLVFKEALPNELGCGLYLQAIARSGKTNLVIETSVGSSSRIVEILPGPPPSAEIAQAPVDLKPEDDE